MPGSSIVRPAVVALAAASVCLAAATGPGRAQDVHGVLVRNAQGQRIVQAFTDWARRWSMPNASIAVMRGERLTGSAGIGTHSPTTAVPIASMSKTITGVCIAKMVDAGLLQFSATIGSLLPDYFAANPPNDPQATSIRVGQLLAMLSGIDYDPSQGDQGGKIEQLQLRRANFTRQVRITLSRPLGHVPGTHYYYNNMNYAILGLVIETLTGETYEDYCHDTVLEPVGAGRAKLNPQWRVMSSWGGWRISAVNYARFLRYFLPSEGLLHTTPAQWPKAARGGGRYYSIGTLQRATPAGHNFWNNGSWQWPDPPSSFGGFFTVIDENVRYAINYEPTIHQNALNDLDISLSTAAHGMNKRTATGVTGGHPSPSLAEQR